MAKKSKAYQAAAAKIEADKFYTPTEAENAAWRKALAPVQKEMASRVGKDLVAALNKEAEAAPAPAN